MKYSGEIIKREQDNQMFLGKNQNQHTAISGVIYKVFFPLILKSDNPGALNSCSSSICEAAFARTASMAPSAPSQQAQLVRGIGHLLHIWAHYPRLIHLVSPLF